MKSKILVVGASGQIGTELVYALRRKHGNDSIIGSDIRLPEKNSKLLEGPFETLDILNATELNDLVEKYNISEIYLLAAMLSATAEKKVDLAWKLNMEGLFNVLNLAKDKKINKIFWPSSIAVFGPTTQKNNTPQHTIMEPTTVYGISKLAGERWCEYYNKVYDVDVRSLRYPGLISYGTLPGGGTTDYAVDIFYKAKRGQKFSCFLSEGTTLPMMYMEDAIQATLKLMEAPQENITIRSGYNISSLSFSPRQLFEAIHQIIPTFEIEYKPDFRQKIAESWPSSINDDFARKDWGWKPNYDLKKMTKIMLENIKA